MASPATQTVLGQEHLRQERLEARLTSSAKELCVKAAAIQGRTLTDFVVQSAVEAAQRIIKEHESLVLTNRDRTAFIEALLNPAAPNEKLKQAARRHAESFTE